MATNAEMKRLIIDLGKISKEVKTELRRGMRKIATPTLGKVKDAAKWSTRVPGATKLTTGFSARRAGIRIETDRNRAPHARPYEHGGKEGYFRHPVWGDQDTPRRDWTWVSQQARPYMLPSAIEDIDEIGGRMLDLVQDVALKNGFHRK
jgi:hypothetical protein